MIVQEFMEIAKSAVRGHSHEIADLRVTAVEPMMLGPRVRWTARTVLPRPQPDSEGFLGRVPAPLILEGAYRYLAARWRHGAPRISKRWDRDLEARHPMVFQHGPCSGGGWSWLWQSSAEWIEDRGIPPGFVTDDTKEKFSTLRWYYHAEGDTDLVDDVIEVAEVLSGAICESCGAPGYARQGAWVKTHCDRCSNGRPRR